MLMHIAGAALLAIALLAAPALAQDVPAAAVATAPTPQPREAPRASPEESGGAFMTGREFILSALIVVFGVLISIIQYLLLRSIVREKTEVITRTFTITLIIVGTMFLIAAGYGTQAISPALGLFGTIAGYLLGRMDQQSSKPSKDAQE